MTLPPIEQIETLDRTDQVHAVSRAIQAAAGEFTHAGLEQDAVTDGLLAALCHRLAARFGHDLVPTVLRRIAGAVEGEGPVAN